MASSIGSRDSVSFLLTIQATGLLTFTLVGLPPTEYASLRWTHLHAEESRLRSRSGVYRLARKTDHRQGSGDGGARLLHGIAWETRRRVRHRQGRSGRNDDD